MEQFEVHRTATRSASGDRRQAIVGVNASGNLEVLVERALPSDTSAVEITTAVSGFRDLWTAVIEDFFDRCATGGLKFSINDGGARPDVVTLRLMQGLQLMERGR